MTSYSKPDYAGFSTEWNPASGQLTSDAVDKNGAVILLRPDRPIGSLIYTYRSDSYPFSAANFQFYSPPQPSLTAVSVSNGLEIRISGGVGPFQLQQRTNLFDDWKDVDKPFTEPVTTVPFAGLQAFFRVVTLP